MTIEKSHTMLQAMWKLREQLATDVLAAVPNPARGIVLDRAFGFHVPIDKALINVVAQELPSR